MAFADRAAPQRLLWSCRCCRVTTGAFAIPRNLAFGVLLNLGLMLGASQHFDPQPNFNWLSESAGCRPLAWSGPAPMGFPPRSF